MRDETTDSHEESNNNALLLEVEALRNENQALTQQIGDVTALMEQVKTVLAAVPSNSLDDIQPLIAFTKGKTIDLQDPSDPYKLRGASMLASDELTIITPCLGGSLVSTSPDSVKAELGSKYSVTDLDDNQLVVALSQLPPWIENLNKKFSASLDNFAAILDAVKTALAVLTPSAEADHDETSSDDSDTKEDEPSQ